MAKKIRLLKADLMKFLDRIGDAVADPKTASAVGFTVRTRMLQLISRGISPILGYGRFPEYKAATRRKVAKRGSAFLGRELRKLNSRIRAGGGSSFSAIARLRAKRDQLKILKQVAATKAARTGYPYNTKQFKAGLKFARPVNLFLTGDFLRSLTFTVKKALGKGVIEIGYFESKQAIKEKGHREGANGQPKRPTLPKGDERWNETIRLDIMRLLRDAITKAVRTAGKGD